jgi:hypothetical protein
VPLRVQIDPVATGKGSHRIEIDVRAVDDERIVAREQTVFLVR